MKNENEGEAYKIHIRKTTNLQLRFNHIHYEVTSNIGNIQRLVISSYEYTIQKRER